MIVLNKYVLYVGEIELPDKNAAAQRVLANCKLLESIGYQPIIVGLSRSIVARKEFDVVNTIDKLNTFVTFEFPYPSSNLEWMKFVWRIDYIEQVLEMFANGEVHAVIAYNFPALALWRLLRFCKRKSIHFVSDVTEWYGASKRSFPSNLVKDMDTWIRMRIVNKKAINLICASSYLQNYYAAHQCNTVLVPSIVDSSDSRWITKLEYSPGQIRRFAYVGSPGIAAEKDRLDWILEALAEVKTNGFSFMFDVVGIDRDTYLGVFEDHQAILDFLRDEVVFHGRISHKAAIECLRRADFSIFVRQRNRVTNAGFPTKLSESFACGIPVITTPTSDIAEHLIDGENGFLCKDFTVSSIQECIEKAINTDTHLIAEMHERCLEGNPLEIRHFVDRMRLFMSDLL